MGELKALPKVEAQLKNFDDVATAQKKGMDVKVVASPGNIRSISSISQGGILAKDATTVTVSSATALKVAVHAVKDAVINGHGLWTWQHMQARVPELRQAASGSEAKALKGKIKTAYKEALNAGKEIEKVLSRRNPEVEKDIKVDNFKDYAAELHKRGKALAHEFSPNGTGWDAVALLSKVDDQFLLMDRDAISKAIEARVKHHIDTFGKLPTRQKTLEMAAQQANTLNMRKDTPAYEDKEIVDLSLTDLSSDHAGFKDFPSQKMQDAVETLAKKAVTAGGDFKDAMTLTYINSEIMLPLHEERLQEAFGLIDQAPKGPLDDARMIAEKKLKHAMPGSSFYRYLSNNMPGVKLRGESIDTYHTLLIQGMRDHAGSMRFVDIAKSAYLCAQKTQVENPGPNKDDPDFKFLAKPFTPELRAQLAKQGEINWIGYLDENGKADLLEHLTKQNKEAVTEEFASTFIEDAHRSDYYFDLGNGVVLKNIEPDKDKKTAITKDALKTFMGDDPVATTTLSKVLGQVAMGMASAELTKCYHDDIEKESVFIRYQGLDREPEVVSLDIAYEVSRPDPDTIRVTHQLWNKPDTATCSFRTFPINRDPKYFGNLNGGNYGTHLNATADFKIEDLRKGLINPVIVGEPMMELHIKPDWGAMHIDQQKEKFKEKLNGYSREQTKAFEDLAFFNGYDFDKALADGQARVPAWTALNKVAPGRIAIADNQETVVKHQFSAAAVKTMSEALERLSTPEDAVGGHIDPNSGLPHQYLADVRRQVNQFVGSDGVVKQAENDAQAIAMLNKLTKNDAASKALGCLCNQSIIGTIASQHMMDAFPGGTLTTIPANTPGIAQWIYKLERLPNGNISLNLDASSPIRGVTVTTPEDGVQTILNRPWPDGQKVTDDNYEMKLTAHLELDKEALEQGNLKIVNTPEYGYALRLKPDWNATI